jgi:c-di-AMP phosphodiesterase-like protein
MSTIEDLLKNENYKKLLDQLSEDERKEVEKNISGLLEKFDQSLAIFLNSIEKNVEG